MDEIFLNKFENDVNAKLTEMLLRRQAIDAILPDCPDVIDRWEKIVTAYLPDGVREFNAYPTASLGWMMFIGMAVAKMWDEDWQMYSCFDDLYTIIRDGRGYDDLDDYVCANILKINSHQAELTSRLVGDCAQMVYSALMHQGIEPGTPAAFNAYVRCLHQLYYFGMAVELRRLGYHMTKLQ